MLYVKKDNQDPPKGFRQVDVDVMMKEFIDIDTNEDYMLSKNEWLYALLLLLKDDISSLEKDGPDSLLKLIKDLSDEFDMYDSNHDKYLSYSEYKQGMAKNIFISE